MPRPPPPLSTAAPLTESKAALAALVRRYNFFEVTPLPEVEEFTSITMAPWPEFQVQVEPVRP